MKAKLQKLSANKDRQDSLQFQMNKDQVEQFRDELMALRRYDNVCVEYESDQAALDLSGIKTGDEIMAESKNLDEAMEKNDKNNEKLAERIYDRVAGTHFPKLKFQATNTSISVCVLEDGWIVTITLSFEDPKVFDHVISHKLRDKMVTLNFTEGSNPYQTK
jgi:hypothetical protein